MSASTKVVVLELEGNGRVEPVRVRLELGPEGQRPTVQQRGELPPCPELMAALDEWRDRYRHLGQLNRALKPQEICYEGRIRLTTPEECRQAAKTLNTHFQAWLSVASFRAIDEQLREEFSRDEPIQVSIRTANHDLQRLPWHLWRFIERYPQAEVGLSAPIAELPPLRRSSSGGQKIRILAILGHTKGIDIDTDRRLLKAIPDADVCFLPSPGRQHLSQSLWDQSWDILFFAGHSETEAAQGRIHLSPHESLTLEELKNSLRAAIAHGLQLAIFNSCDGLGLAYELEQLNIPQMIVMREPVPDPVAQAFLKSFLQAFSQGQSLYEAVREARERLEGVEGEFPCASWLPVIYENPTAPAVTWKALQGSERSPFSFSDWWQHLAAVDYWQFVRPLSISLVATLIVVGLRLLGVLQPWELQAYDHIMRSLQNPHDISSRIIAVTIDDGDLEYQSEQGIRSEGSISDAALLRLLTQIAPYQPTVIGFDIIHDFPFIPELEARLQTADNFIAICQVDIPQSELPGILPPADMASDDVGFINFPLDYDGVLRRQLLVMAADNFCPSTQSLSFKIATRYLQQTAAKNLEAEIVNEFSLRQGSGFQQVSNTAGGYRLPKQEVSGVQILTDYRLGKIKEIPLREVLYPTQASLKGIFENKIVLIGVKMKNKDRHITPLTSDFTRQTSGVVVHAAMIETLLRVALGELQAIAWWPEFAEVAWIAFWALICALLGIFSSHYWFSLTSIGLGLGHYLIALYGMSRNLWLPLVPVILAIAIVVILSSSWPKHRRL